MTAYIYTMSENKLTGNTSIVKDGCEAFVRFFSYVIDRLYKISSVRDLKIKIDYAAAIYYQVNIVGKDLNKNYDSIKATAMKISDAEPKQAQIVDIMLERADLLDIDKFITAIKRMFNFKDLTTDAVVAFWMKAYGTGTVFALEYLPALCAMCMDSYIGGYINQQATIEKIAGQSMVKLSKTILQIGATV